MCEGLLKGRLLKVLSGLCGFTPQIGSPVRAGGADGRPHGAVAPLTCLPAAVTRAIVSIARGNINIDKSCHGKLTHKLRANLFAGLSGNQRHCELGPKL